MTSYHEYNKVEKARVLVEKLKSGMNIACITDAGTPGISDPGEELVRQCCEAGIKVTALPGAVACVTALIISGLPTRRFCFEAFLPTDKKEHQRVLADKCDIFSIFFDQLRKIINRHNSPALFSALCFFLMILLYCKSKNSQFQHNIG